MSFWSTTTCGLQLYCALLVLLDPKTRRYSYRSTRHNLLLKANVRWPAARIGARSANIEINEPWIIRPGPGR